MRIHDIIFCLLIGENHEKIAESKTMNELNCGLNQLNQEKKNDLIRLITINERKTKSILNDCSSLSSSSSFITVFVCILLVYSGFRKMRKDDEER